MVTKSLRSCIIASILLLAALCPSTFGKTIYVDDNDSGANNGTSWENAYTFLQDALADANSAEKPVEIRVAQGIYKPDQGANQTPVDREATFLLLNGVTLKGGYAGFGEPDPNGRDIIGYETILSGDLNGNDLYVADPCDLYEEPTRAENSYNVVTAFEVDETTVLDGFTVTGGNADGPISYGEYPDEFRFRCGGGMYNCESSPTLTNCTFSVNAASRGGGLYNYGGSPMLTNCKFIANFAINCGGGMENSWRSWYQEQCEPTLIKCKFTANVAEDGGGMFNETSSPWINNCVFIMNFARWSGGGMCNINESNPTINFGRFIANSVIYYGGGLHNHKSSPMLYNCTIIGNKTSMTWSEGGGIMNWTDSSPTLVNCTLSDNYAYMGGGIQNGRNVCAPELINCIVWGNIEGGHLVEPAQIRDGTPIINYCCVQDWEGTLEGEGNTNIDPCFVETGYWTQSTSRYPSVWMDGDYHLKSETGRWDPNSQSWVVDNVTSPCIDIGDPNSPVGDEPEPNGDRINMGAYGGTAEASMSPGDAEEIVYVQWLGHSTVKVWTDDCIVYIDPERVPETFGDATLVCVTHTHGDHYSPSDIAKVSNAETQFIAPPDVISQYGRGLSIAPWQAMEFDFINIKAVPSYNTNKTNHPKSRNWVGYIIELGGKRIYVAGDTDLIDEMKSLGDIDVAFLPAGGTYTMNATEAAEATEYIKPDLAIPYHWGQSVGTLADAQRFAELARCPAMVLTVGEMISSDNWPEYSPLIAHWALDEAKGNIAHDSAGENHGTLEGEPAWQPAGGKIAGAIQLDGIIDYISTEFVLNPADGAFSVFAWIKGDVPGQVVISQADGSGETWLGADPLDGKLMTGLVLPAAGRFVPQPLVSESIIMDGQWHHIGFAWDGSYKALYVDGTEVARDTAAQNPLKSADGGLYIGAGKNLDVGNFFSGMIDDVRIYNKALTAEEIEELAN